MLVVTILWLHDGFLEHMQEGLQPQFAFHIAELPREAEACWNSYQ